MDEEQKDDEEGSKLMMHLYDDNELMLRKKEQMYGNMYLITELYVARQLNGNIIKMPIKAALIEIFIAQPPFSAIITYRNIFS